MPRPSEPTGLVWRPSPSFVLDRLDRAAAALDAARTRLDDLNVFPVADGDTGSNMAITLGEASAAVRGAVSSFDDLLDRLPTAAMRAARGNSGLLLAAWLAGACRSLPRAATWPADPTPAVAAALGDAAASSRRSVDEPVEGTFLSVADAAAAAADPAAGGDVPALVAAAADAATAAVLRTPDQLPVLRQHGVVDAGGLGLVVVLRSLGDDALDVHGWIDAAMPDGVVPIGAVGPTDRDPTDGDGRLVEVMLDVETADGDLLAERWRDLGDSIVVAGGPRRWHGHLHTTRPGAAIEVATALGDVSNVRTTSVHDHDPVAVPGAGEGRSA